MFIITTKVNKKKVLLGLGLVAAFALGIFAAVPRLQGDGAQATAGEVKVEKKKLKTDEARRSYLEQFGWELAEGEPEISQVRIPESFNATYESYNELQKRQGFDLSKYTGKDMQLFRYGVTNHPSGEEGVTANLLLYKNKVVGGEISSAQLEGFLHCLNENMPGTQQDTRTPESGQDAQQSATDGQQDPAQGEGDAQQDTQGEAQQAPSADTTTQDQETVSMSESGIYYLDTEE